MSEDRSPKAADVYQIAEFSYDHFIPKYLYSSNKVRVVVLCLEPGQGMPSHSTPDACLYVVSGRGTITIDGQVIPVQAGSVVVCPPGAYHSVHSIERMIVLSTVAMA